MIFINLVLLCASAAFFENAVGEPPKFRILAPPFVCPKDEDDVIDKPDTTVVTLQTEPGLEVKFKWTVRWLPVDAPTQRLTLALWRTVRELELKLNQPPIEHNVFVINNTELLSGVNYIFNVTAISDGEVTEKIFNINNTKGDHELEIEGKLDNMFSIALIGGQLTYTELGFTLDAQVTSCFRTQDYYFVWTVTSVEGKVDVLDEKGARLEIRANTLTPGLSYDVLCQVYKSSNEEFITQSSLPFRVQHRDLEIHFNLDVLLITVDKPFSLQTDVNKLDFLESGLTLAWVCTFDGEPVDTFYESDDDGTLTFPNGLPDVGEHFISVTVGVLGQTISTRAIARIIAVEPPLPVIEVYFTSRLLNEDSLLTLKANVTDVVPGCSITWYFNSELCMKNSSAAENCSDSEHGTPISAPVNFYSLEENFLSELTDYSNETSWKAVFADMEAAGGRARVVAQCECTKVDDCTGEGTVYADVWYRVNHKPLAGDVLVMPETGTAMETVFRLSTLAIVDPNRPIRYSFYCELNSNDTLLLGSYSEHLAIETFLPYINGGTAVWVEVCDSLGACSPGAATIVQTAPGEARTVDAMIEDLRAHVLRCEMMALRRMAATAVVTYTNAGQIEAFSKISAALQESLDNMDEHCIERHYDEYSTFVHWLARSGIDINYFES